VWGEFHRGSEEVGGRGKKENERATRKIKKVCRFFLFLILEWKKNLGENHTSERGRRGVTIGQSKVVIHTKQKVEREEDDISSSNDKYNRRHPVKKRKKGSKTHRRIHILGYSGEKRTRIFLRGR